MTAATLTEEPGRGEIDKQMVSPNVFFLGSWESWIGKPHEFLAHGGRHLAVNLALYMNYEKEMHLF